MAFRARDNYRFMGLRLLIHDLLRLLNPAIPLHSPFEGDLLKNRKRTLRN